MRLELLMSKVSPEPMTGCWLWTGSVDNNGYGRLRMMTPTGNRPISAHRASWAIHTGELPPSDIYVLHKCDVGACVNPEHLYLGTQLENMRDMLHRGRNPRVLQTTCKHGHELSGDNLRLTENNRRKCRECARLFSRERYKRIR